jgi:hypothetical protein
MFRNTAHVYDLIYEASGKDYAAEARKLRDLIVARAGVDAHRDRGER